MEFALKKYKVSEVKIINQNPLSENQGMKLSARCGIRMDDCNHCSVKLIATIYLPDEDIDQEDPSFLVTLGIEGFFDYQDMDSDQLQSKGAEALLPLLRSHFATVMAASGLDPIVIPIERMQLL